MKNTSFIRKIRLQMGLTQNQLAEALEVTQGAIHHWEIGSHDPSINHAHALLKLAAHHKIKCELYQIRKE